MLHRTSLALVAFAAALFMSSPSPAQDAPQRTFALDAVELISGGKEVQGDAGYSSTRGAYTYQFATPANKAEFEKTPAKYEIQLGGACARMGPLSGEGRCDIYAVHAGKLYLFASQQCRDGFLKAPEKLLETDDAAVTADAATQQRGRELLDLATTAHGGAAAIDAVRTYRQRIEAQTEYQGKPVCTDQVYLIAFPDCAREESYWGEQMWAHSAAGSLGGFWTEKGFDRPMADTQVRSVRRQLNHHLLTILKARRRPDFVAARVGEAAIHGIKVERVAVSFDGTTCTLGIDPATGRVQTLAYRGRGGERNTLGTVEKTFGDWQTLQGVLLPTSWTSTFDGQPAGDKPTRLSKVEVNAELGDTRFVARAGQ